MDNYTPKNRRPLSWLSMIFRSLSYLLRHWLLLCIAALILSPISPYIRVYYTYIDYGAYKDYNDCTYFGGRGLVERDLGDICPVIVVMDQAKMF